MLGGKSATLVMKAVGVKNILYSSSFPTPALCPYFDISEEVMWYSWNKISLKLSKLGAHL